MKRLRELRARPKREARRFFLKANNEVRSTSSNLKSERWLSLLKLKPPPHNSTLMHELRQSDSLIRASSTVMRWLSVHANKEKQYSSSQMKLVKPCSTILLLSARHCTCKLINFALLETHSSRLSVLLADKLKACFQTSIHLMRLPGLQRSRHYACELHHLSQQKKSCCLGLHFVWFQMQKWLRVLIRLLRQSQKLARLQSHQLATKARFSKMILRAPTL